ncbi:MAG: PAS domain S-box protein [bacterium]|nr:PAS domain S-box protein [bacterium]
MREIFPELEKLLECVHILIMDMEFRIVFWGMADIELYGFSREEAIGHTAYDLLKTEFPYLLEKIKADLISEGKWHGDLVHTLKNGERITVNSCWVLYTDNNGSPTAIVEVNSDITERKLAEERLEKNLRDMEYLSATAMHLLEPMSHREFFRYTAEQLQAVSGNAMVALSEYDPRKDELIVRALSGPADKLQRVVAILGRDPVGLRYRVSKDIRERMARGRLDSLEGGVCDLIFNQMPLLLCKQIEEELHLGCIYAMPFSLDKDFMGIAAVIIDRDEGLKNSWLVEAIVNQATLALKRNKTEKDLKRSEARFRATFDHAGIGMTIVDVNGRIIKANPVFVQVIGYTLQELTNMHVNDYIYPPDQLYDNELLQEMIDGKRDSYQTEKRYVAKDGRIIWGKLAASIARNPAPEPPFIIRMVEDITERKLSDEREAKRKEEQLEFYRRTILAATEGKLVITEKDEIFSISGETIATWPLEEAEKLSNVRHEVIEIVKRAGIAEARVDVFAIAVGEALTNAIKHAHVGTATMHKLADALMLVVTDQGPGIPALTLPEVALKRGYSTAGTLGMGYKFMITFADRVYLATGPGGTTVGLLLQFQPPKKPQTELLPLCAMLAIEQEEREL